LAVVALAGVGGLASQVLAPVLYEALRGADPAATFVGSDACAGCHQAETKLWQSSHHKLAMDHASDKSVLGDFADASFDTTARTALFRRRKILVETDGRTASSRPSRSSTRSASTRCSNTCRISGRPQALSIAQTAGPRNRRQRWFHLYPDENIQHDDVLH
jgi:hypothetical protein